MYTVKYSSKIKRDLKLIQKRGKDIEKLKYVVKILAHGKELPSKYKDHSLIGDYTKYRECHIEPDWLLIYKIEKDKLILILSRTGTHSDLF